VNRTARIVTFLCCVVLAIGVNLATCVWGTDRSETAIMTFDGGLDGSVGAFAAPWLVGHPLAGTLLGIVLPMALVGLGAYFLVREPASRPAEA